MLREQSNAGPLGKIKAQSLGKGWYGKRKVRSQEGRRNGEFRRMHHSGIFFVNIELFQVCILALAERQAPHELIY